MYRNEKGIDNLRLKPCSSRHCRAANTNIWAMDFEVYNGRELTHVILYFLIQICWDF